MIVDSASGAGPVSVDASLVSNDCPTQPADSFSNLPQGDFDTLSHAMTTSCGAHIGFQIVGYELPDYLGYIESENAPADCDFEITATAPVSVAVIEGRCEGREVSCQVFDTVNAGNFMGVVDIPSTGEFYTLVVSPMSAAPTTFTSNALCVAP